MKLTLVQVGGFVAKWKRLGLTDDDLRAMERAVMAAPGAAPVIAGTGGLRKMRFAPPSWGRGKSGATRVIYLDVPEAEAAFFIAIYTKSEQSNLTAAEKATFKELVGRIKRGLSNRRKG